MQRQTAENSGNTPQTSLHFELGPWCFPGARRGPDALYRDWLLALGSFPLGSFPFLLFTPFLNSNRCEPVRTLASPCEPKSHPSSHLVTFRQFPRHVPNPVRQFGRGNDGRMRAPAEDPAFDLFKGAEPELDVGTAAGPILQPLQSSQIKVHQGKSN